jgi:hypothetical protein
MKQKCLRVVRSAANRMDGLHACETFSEATCETFSEATCETFSDTYLASLRALHLTRMLMRLIRLPFVRPALALAVRSGLRPCTSITYSGGHPTEGQGGFYGSGGARANAQNEYVMC